MVRSGLAPSSGTNTLEWPCIVTFPPLSTALTHRSQMRALRSVVAMALVLFAAIAGLVVPADRANASSCSGPLSGGEIRVVLVVDATDLGGGSSATCLVVPAGTTGSQVLARRGSELGSGSPRYGSSGLLCAIDGLPATGCGDRNSSGFGYWAYFFSDGGGWIYGNNNPFTKRLADGAIEGWRFVAGGCGCGQDPAPQIWPAPSLFPALAPSLPELPSLPPVTTAGSSATGGTTGASGAVASADGTPVVSESSVAVAAEAPATPPTSVEAVVVGDVALASASHSDSNVGRWIGIAAVFVLIAIMAGGAWIQTRRTR